MALNLNIFSLISSLILFKLITTINAQGTVIGEKYYLPYTIERVSWYRAYQLCAKVDMQLASIESETEHKELGEHLLANCKY